MRPTNGLKILLNFSQRGRWFRFGTLYAHILTFFRVKSQNYLSILQINPTKEQKSQLGLKAPIKGCAKMKPKIAAAVLPITEATQAFWTCSQMGPSQMSIPLCTIEGQNLEEKATDNVV